MLPTSPPGSLPRATPRPAAKQSFDDTQLAVIQSQARNLVVEAFAGAGKTTTAIGYAAERPDARILYLCFGKKNQVEAQARFGSNVECRTTHSLAYAAVGQRFKGQIAHSLRPRDLASQLKIIDLRLAAVVQAVLGHFFSSTDREVGPEHVLAAKDDWGLSESEIDGVLSHARFAWQRMSTVGSGVSISHDGYLKLWALSKPRLSKYSHIILDEAQDTAPVMSEIMSVQADCTRLLIGDRHQSIYLFRGATNAMEQFSASGATVLKMPRTWRFGPEIAGYANRILSMFKCESTAIIGAGPSKMPAPGLKRRAVLSRTNVGLYEEAADVWGRGTHWVGGIDDYKVDSLADAWLLMKDRRREIIDPHLRGFDSWSRFKDEADQTRDQSAKMLVKLIDRYGDAIPRLVDAFKKNALPTEAGAQLILSTAHKAKGLDFGYVQVGEDFSCLNKALEELTTSRKTSLTHQTAQEINLLYVAITRARQGVQLNKETKEFLLRYDQHLRTVMTSVGLKHGLNMDGLNVAAAHENSEPLIAPPVPA